jgi:SAM-dependent methyltransferase
MDTEELQKRHYDRIAAEYAAHYGDAWSERYREAFMNAPMTDGLALAGARVVDAMCGSGETTGHLVARGAQVVGLDISPQEMAEFARRWPGCETRCASILHTGLADASVDAVFVVGGLHHVHPRVDDALAEIHRILKPGGHFRFVEPHRGSLPDRVRRAWYARDRYFAENEESIDVEAMKRAFGDRFEFGPESYGGNLAYLLVLNSLILRMPLWLKPWYARPLLALERAIAPLQGRATSCFVVGRWRKRTPDGAPGGA